MATQNITATVVSGNTLSGTASPGSTVDVAGIAIGGVRLSELSDVVIDDKDKKTGALMTYDASTGGFRVLTEVSAPSLKLTGGAF